MTSYFANVGPESGPVRDRDTSGATGVLPGRANNLPIGIAFQVGRTDERVAIWKLTVHGVDVPGRWIIVDHEFRPVPACGPS